MERKKASDFDQRLLDLYDAYAHGRVSRREFLDRAGAFTAVGVSAAAVLQMLSPNYAWAQQVDPKDASLKNEYVEYNSPNGNGRTRAYVSRPASGPAKMGGVVVVHENRGLNPYIEDVARRLGKEGFVAFAPDGLTSLGGYPGNDEAGVAMQQKIDGGKLLQDFFAAYETVRARPDVNGKVGAVGFCYGGGVVNQLAVRYPDMAAGVPYYGVQPNAADSAKIKAPIMAQYAGLDTRITDGWPAYETALKAAKVEASAYIYANTNHGFHNDTTPRYDEAAAKLSWTRTTAFFKQKLAGGNT